MEAEFSVFLRILHWSSLIFSKSFCSAPRPPDWVWDPFDIVEISDRRESSAMAILGGPAREVVGLSLREPLLYNIDPLRENQIYGPAR